MTLTVLNRHIGKPLNPGQWFTIDQSRIDQFAEVTGDHQFIHIDPERARQTALGGTIAHGFLTLSLLTTLAKDVMPVPENLVMGINYGFDKVRFLNPVKPGDAVRLCATVADVQEKPALVCEWLNFFCE
jgi:acyl dehydratase